MRVKDILGVNNNHIKLRGPRRRRRHQHSLIKEGGGMDGVGAIHISEIKPTLEKMEKVLGVPMLTNTLGSVGKKQFSGDIDIALQISEEDLPAFIDKLKSLPEVHDVRKTSVIMTKVEIENYDDSKETEAPRTGFVQIDFMIGDPDWLKTYYHSPSEKESKYKGHYRNVMIALIASQYNMDESDEKIADGRPLKIERYMWSPADGLTRVIRTPKPNKAGTGFTKQNQNSRIDGPWQKPDDIAMQLGLGTGEVLNSFETLYAAVRSHYPKELQDRIFKAFVANEQVQDMGVPDELSSYDRGMIEMAEAAYDGNIGIIEMMKFYKIASADQVAKLKELIASGKKSAAWDLIEKVTGVKLVRDTL